MDLRQLQKDVSTALMTTVLVQSLQRGQVTNEQYIAYLSDVYSYALHSAQVIALAGARLGSTHPDLSRYLFTHAAEELGHEGWAASDLHDLGLSETDITRIQPSSACRRMIALEYFYAAHDNAVGLFGWMFVLESLGGRVGGGIATALDQALHLNGKALYFLRGHGEADAHHSEDLYRVVSEHVRSPEDLAAFASMAKEAQELYCGILDAASAGSPRVTAL